MKNIYRTFIWTYNYILDFIIPRFCVGCQKEHEILCQECFDASYQKWANCLVCGTRNMTGSFCLGNCRKQAPLALKKVYWVGKYDDILKKAVSQLKYRKRQELMDPLGKLVAKKFFQYSAHLNSNKYCIVPIPLHPNKQNERGFNQSELIARAFAKETGIQLRTDLLRKIVNTAPQAKTSNKNERMKNLKNTFEANSEVFKINNERTILLIDDVSTTGATLFHASNALSIAGATNIIGIVVAHG